MSLVAAEVEDGLLSLDACVLQGRLKNLESMHNLYGVLGHLSGSKWSELAKLIVSYPCLFSDTPTQIPHLIEHDIDVGDSQPVSCRPVLLQKHSGGLKSNGQRITDRLAPRAKHTCSAQVQLHTFLYLSLSEPINSHLLPNTVSRLESCPWLSASVTGSPNCVVYLAECRFQCASPSKISLAPMAEDQLFRNWGQGRRTGGGTMLCAKVQPYAYILASI